MKHGLLQKCKGMVLKRLALLFFIGTLSVSNVCAQLSVSGKVISSEDQGPLPGVNIIVKGTVNGTITDADGNYSITTSSQNDILTFSFVGYVMREASVEGRNIINITLATDSRQLSEVVVTALGIRKEERSLGYSAQSVDENAVKDAKSKQIILQKYYAYFFVDYQSWFEKRRTGYPVLPRGTGIPAENNFPSRVPYPTYLQSLNPEGLAAAVNSMGGDNSGVKVWWEKE